MASAAINGSTTDDPSLLEVVPRLAHLISIKEELASFKLPLTSLARSTGLWNYIDKDVADISDLLLAESVTLPELDDITLHREQVSALNELLRGNNLILSAPTSFGKSLLIDALLASAKYKRVAIVLPTIALLDEFRRRLRRRFESVFNVVMHPSDTSDDKPTIFLGTQERLLNRDDLGTLDLTVVDEFYKLDPNRDDSRAITLNAAVYKLLARSRQFFFLGPNIDHVHVSDTGRWKFHFHRTRFSTVAVDTFDLRNADDRYERVFDVVENDENWPALVFVSSPDKANKLASEAAERMAVSDDGSDFAKWLADNVGPTLPLIETVRFGFAVHHGRIPRAIASHMIRLFNLKKLPVLFCTSTLIEGVNTAAKSVLIYDKQINRKDYDFFTVSNIKGRAGRLGQHKIGKVFLFNDPPPIAETDVSPTLFADEDEAPDDYVVHLDDPAGGSARDEVSAEWMSILDVDQAGLRLAAQVGLEGALALKQQIERELIEANENEEVSRLIWSGLPEYKNLLATLSTITTVRSPSTFGAFSAKQLAFSINKLRKAATMRRFLLDHDQTYKGHVDSRDGIFKFLRACEYGLPQWLGLVELFVSQHASVDFSYFIRELSRWFRAEELKNLDEEGIPIQISERFHCKGETRAELIQRLIGETHRPDSDLSSFEKSWVSAAIDIRLDR